MKNSQKKIESEEGCWQTECWGGWVCSGRLICYKIGGFVICCRADGGRRRKEGGEEKDCSSNHKLNITNGFTDRFH